MSPRIAFRAVLLPAPFGPTIPRMRPSSTRRSMPSTATVAPYVLRRPRASMHVMASALLLGQQFFGTQTEPLNRCMDPRPLLLVKLLTLALQQQVARAGIDEHAAASLRLDEMLVDQLLVALQDRDRIDPIVGRHRAHGRQRIALVEHAVEDHRDDPVAKLAVNRLTVVPFEVHR